MIMDGRQSGERDGTKRQNDRVLGCRKSALGPPLYMAVEKRRRDKKPEYMGVAQKSVRKTLIPDRGRKLELPDAFMKQRRGPKDPNPRQGTETQPQPPVQVRGRGSPKDPTPRQGTETFHPQSRARGDTAVRKTLIPDRGRKHYLDTEALHEGLKVRKTLIPDRGRKQTISAPFQVSISLSPKDPNPRQGTETKQPCRTYEVLHESERP